MAFAWSSSVRVPLEVRSHHIWAAARYNIPGFVAHESALRNGELLEIPDLGDPPPGRRFLEEDLATLAPSQILWDLPAPKSSP